MKQFADEHWRDLVAMFILYSGVAVALFAPESADKLGLPLVVAGLAMLKLSTKNGGNNAS